MSIIGLFRHHAHYWGVPHARPSDGRLVQTCYECGAERQVKVELRPSPVAPAADPSQRMSLPTNTLQG